VLLAVKQNGFHLIRGFAPGLSTLEVATALGTVISVRELLPTSGIRTVQSLRPRNTHEVGKNQYSGHFGMETFPLHTDLAHWALPPHYLVLRCIIGSNDVFTHILPWARILDLIGAATLRKAVFTPRSGRHGRAGLVRAMSQHGLDEVLRWDPIFLRPINHHARTLASVMLDSTWDSKVTKILLLEPGDTILIDNWQMMRGRGRVLPQSLTRRVERVYLSEVYQ
jgi:L-asparagine oxygenase